MKYTIELIARNIVNLQDIDTFISFIILDQNIQKQEIKIWLNKSLKDYIKNELQTVKPVTTVKKNDPEWLKKSVEDGTALKVNFNRGFKNQIFHIIDYFNSLPPVELTKIVKIPFKIAIDKSKEWLQQLHEQSSIEEDFEGIETVRSYKEGYSWVRVESGKALNREGKLMRHCVGSYAAKVSSKQCVIYSLRDPNNKPHCTVEIIKNTVNQIKGFANGPIVEKYIKFVKDFIEKPIDGEGYRKVRELLSNLGLLNQDGIWYNIFNLPNNFTVNRSLYLKNTKFKTLAENLTINGNLVLRSSNVKFLPENLTVEKTLDIEYSTLKELPKNLHVKRHLILNSRIAELPKDLIVEGELRANKKLLYSTIPLGVNKVKFKLRNEERRGKGNYGSPAVWGEFENGELKKTKSRYSEEEDIYLYDNAEEKRIEREEVERETREMIEDRERIERDERNEQRQMHREVMDYGY